MAGGDVTNATNFQSFSSNGDPCFTADRATKSPTPRMIHSLRRFAGTLNGAPPQAMYHLYMRVYHLRSPDNARCTSETTKMPLCPPLLQSSGARPYTSTRMTKIEARTRDASGRPVNQLSERSAGTVRCRGSRDLGQPTTSSRAVTSNGSGFNPPLIGPMRDMSRLGGRHDGRPNPPTLEISTASISIDIITLDNASINHEY